MTGLEVLVLLLACKATLILGLVAGIFVLAGRRWPQKCLLCQRLGVTALLALPVAGWALPTVGVPVLSVPRPITIDDDAEQTRPLATPVRRVAGGETASRRNPSAVPEASSTESALHGLPPSNMSIPGLFLAAAYGVVLMALLVRFLRAWRGLTQLKRASSLVVDPVWQATLKHWSSALRVGHPVELRMSDTVSVPMTFYWRAPVILIPGDCISRCDQTQRDAIVVHELTHIAQGDFLWHAMTRLAAAIYWIHPLVWLLRRQDGILCERVCDASCSHHLSRELYARALVRIAGHKISRPVAALGIAMARSSSLRRRLTDLQSGATPPYSLLTRTQRVLLGGTAGLILGLIVVGTLTARASAEAAAPAAQVRMPATINGQVLDRQDKPVANAKVIVRVVRCDSHGYPTGAAAPQPWTAATDDQGRYRFKTRAPWLGRDDVLSIKIRAEGFPELSTQYFGAGAQSPLPVQRLPAGRTVLGRLVDPQGNPVAKAIVRFYASSDSLMFWDSGPLPVDQRGMFSVLIPKEGQAAVAIYPHEFAPQIVKVANSETDLGPIRVEGGISVTGRVVDKAGRGVAGTVVGVQDDFVQQFLRLGTPIGTAVKTDENGSFRLPPLRGTYRVWVTNDAPDYSRQLTVSGVAPPPILPQRIDFNGEGKTREVIFREAGSATLRGTVRWADGSGVPDIEIRSQMMPPGWKSGANLASVRTDSKGRYVLRLPAPVPEVIIWVDQFARAPDGQEFPVKPVKRGAKQRQLTFALLTGDVDDADWVVGSNGSSKE
ncbi:MAG TPA: M56 family metallopeptidase [Planctomycetaceae bacterium]|nr:M56 family metallopeptidase [Planctomycetaceae bacterium]